MTLNEHEIKELQTHYGKRFEPLLMNLVRELSVLVGDCDSVGMGFLASSITRLLGAAIRRMPDQAEETGTVH